MVKSKVACVGCGVVGDVVTVWHRDFEKKGNFHLCMNCRRSRGVE